MGLDIGLCEANASEQLSLKENLASSSSTSQPNGSQPVNNMMDRHRTLLACYLLCSGYDDIPMPPA